MTARRRVYVAVDAGTGGGKCVLFDGDGRRLGSHRQPWSYHVTTHPELPLVKEFEFDGEEFWRILCHCIRSALAAAHVDPREVAAVAATSQREGCVFLDDSRREIYAGPNIDSRAFAEGLEILSTLGPERLHGITGHSAPFIFPLARYLWHRKHRPGRVAHLLMINDWITFRLCGVLAAEPSNATESMLFDLRQRRWSEEILQLFEVPPAILPPVHEPGTRIGSISPAAAEVTGLAPATPVFVGGADTQCSLLGAGVLEPFSVGATLGTTSPVQMVVAAPTFDPAHRLWAGCHVVPDRWVLESNAGDTGDAYLWLLRLVGGDRDVEELVRMGEELAQDDTPTPVYSFIGPAIFDMTQVRADRPGGLLFPYPLLHLRPDRGEIVRSFLDSIGYAIRGNCEQIERVTGTAPARVTLSGGLSRSRALVRRAANILGLPVFASAEPESAALGCAVLMAAGTGDAADLAEAVGRMVRLEEVAPEAGALERYRQSYRKWVELNDGLDRMSI